jgi:hypothetical protein
MQEAFRFKAGRVEAVLVQREALQPRKRHREHEKNRRRSHDESHKRRTIVAGDEWKWRRGKVAWLVATSSIQEGAALHNFNPNHKNIKGASLISYFSTISA